MSADLVRELHAVLDQLMYEHSARVVILRGEVAESPKGNGGFCAGFDFKDTRLYGANMPAMQSAMSGLVKKLRELPQPVVCGVHGSAAGGGYALALAADVRVAGRSARFVPSFVHLGLGGAEMGTSYFLPRII